jgi:ketosteroid isomerase-like protein
MTNKEIVQQCYADFGSGNINGLLQAFAEDIVWVDPGHIGNLYKGTRNGKNEVVDFFTNLPMEITITHFELLQLNESGHKVFAEGTITGYGNATKKTFSLNWLMVWELENKLVIKHCLFLDTLAMSRIFENQTTPAALQNEKMAM